MLVVRCWSYCRWKRWILSRFTVLLTETMYIWDYTEIAIILVIRKSPPNHGYTKGEGFSLSVSPLSNMLLTCIANVMQSPWFVLITKLDFEVCKISNFQSVSLDGELVTGIVICIRIIHTSWWCIVNFYKINGIYQALHMLEQYDMRTH